MFFSGSNIKSGKEIINSLYFFNELQMLDCNQYIIQNTETEQLCLFDAGNGKTLKGLFEGMEKLGLNHENITKVFLTHEHVDHVLGLYKLLDLYQDNPPQIYAYGRTAEILREGKESEIFPGNLGISARMFGVNIRPINVRELRESDPIKIGKNYEFTIYHTPGHSEGSIVYYERNKKVLIAGDLVFTGGSFGRYDFPGGSLRKLQDSIEFVNNLDVKYLLPGHMNISNNGNQQIEASNKMVHSTGLFY